MLARSALTIPTSALIPRNYRGNKKSATIMTEKEKERRNEYAVYSLVSLGAHSIPTLLPAQTWSESLKEQPPVFLHLCHALSLILLLPRCVLLLIWLPWHFNFHLTRPAYIMLIIQANLLAATCPPRFLSPDHLKRTESSWRRRWVVFAVGFMDCASLCAA